MTTLHGAIQEEIRRERERGNTVERIRVTGTALAGSTVALPIQSIRWKYGVREERRHELLVHPDDWALLLEEMEGVVGEGIAGLRRAFGLPVADET